MKLVPQNRVEAILKSTIEGTEYKHRPESRIEYLLLELKEVIEEGGGGGGGTMDYNKLHNKPTINGHELSGDLDAEDLDLDEPLTNEQLDNLLSLIPD